MKAAPLGQWRLRRGRAMRRSVRMGYDISITIQHPWLGFVASDVVYMHWPSR